MHITVLLTDDVFDRAVKELARSFEVNDAETSKRIRSVMVLIPPFGTNYPTG